LKSVIICSNELTEAEIIPFMFRQELGRRSFGRKYCPQKICIVLQGLTPAVVTAVQIKELYNIGRYAFLDFCVMLVVVKYYWNFLSYLSILSSIAAKECVNSYRFIEDLASEVCIGR
jgi:hypothetical protein